CGIPHRLSKTPGRVVTRAPKVGEHNDDIYKKLLNYSDEQIQKLQQQGTI
ncbi:MAG: CoA transferase, partial [Deltaproteobacteria bacterium]|nr:CoA transferase [Deltaproteobacteria bacterium]